MAVDEKLEMINYCFDKTVNSVISQLPNEEETYAFKTCLRKYARVKMRAVTYYHKHMHFEDAQKGEYLLKNLKMMKAFLPTQ